jgi:class 3 adenylate cyclase
MTNEQDIYVPGAAALARAEAAARAVPYKLAEAYARRDIEALAALFADDPDVLWVGTGPDEKRIGPLELRAQFERNLEQSEILLFRFDWVKAATIGPAAWVAADGSMQATFRGWEINVPVRFTAVLRAQGDDWVIIQAHLSCPAAGQAEGESFPTSLEEVADAVRRERPDLGAHSAPDGTVTILFTDIEASSSMTERLGDKEWIEVLREHNAIVREHAEANGGFEVKSRGDGFMLAFRSARSALLCAIGLQRAFAERNRVRPEVALRIRVGLHTGEAIREADDFFGKNVILAARIAESAKGTQILASSLVKALTESAGDIFFGEEHRTELRGLSGSYRLFEVLWEDPG